MAGSLEMNFDNARAMAFFKGLDKTNKAILNHRDDYAQALGALVLKDVVSHFKDESGPDGKWPHWSFFYTLHMERLGKGGNKMLQDSGRLRQTLTPKSYKKKKDGIEWYNNAKTKKGFPYAYAHNEGGKQLPKREFMWASPGLLDKVSKLTLAFFLKGRL